MKADEEWQSLEGKLNGTETGWNQTTVIPLLSLASSVLDDEVTSALRDGMMDPSAQVPASDTEGDPMLPVGGLDLNVGVNLPAEELQGQLPKVSSRLRAQKTAYAAHCTHAAACSCYVRHQTCHYKRNECHLFNSQIDTLEI